MSGVTRAYPLFSLCGLNCGLCSMHIGGHCPGCGGGEGNQSCAIARCGKARGVEFCIHCGGYPCARYDGIDEYDSFISHLHQKQDLEKLGRIGLDAYRLELEEKVAILSALLEGYNDGRHKSSFCAAVNLLELGHLRAVMETLKAESTPENTPDSTPKEKAALASRLLAAAAAAQGVLLKLRKKK
ncbi:MAG: DUF3795 domain-containing protein [Gemmiger sp.]|nr:DUF3795 domain-containing protein [Gemmiger sp.]